MSEPVVSAARASELFAYDRETGVLLRRTTAGSRARGGEPAGSFNRTNGYMQVRIGKRNYQQHRVIWLIETGFWPKAQIDHVNGNRVDNRWANLRDVTRSVNMQNLRVARTDNKTGLLGVSESRGRFRASIKVDGGQRHIGTFDRPEDAHDAYLKVKRQIHEGGML